MENPEKIVLLKKDVMYKFCTCGASQTIPFCDQSHEKLNIEKNCSYKSLRVTPHNDVEMTVTSKNWEKA